MMTCVLCYRTGQDVLVGLACCTASALQPWSALLVRSHPLLCFHAKQQDKLVCTYPESWNCGKGNTQLQYLA